jgi:hypothetical protein
VACRPARIDRLVTGSGRESKLSNFQAKSPEGMHEGIWTGLSGTEFLQQISEFDRYL